MSENNVILLVEDNEDDIELTVRALKKNNVVNEIITVRDGEEALDYLFARGPYNERPKEKMPNLILLDLKMPKVGGIEVLKVIRTTEALKHIPVVVLTTSDEERDIIESYRLGANSYIRKPVDFVQFTEAIRQLGLYWLVLNVLPGKR